ncbi:MAG TPA: hypothetical protein VMQ67_08600 [Candidatus Saccharimonadales bacterium]|nr:hypothetical protein [Candidatus Saccharimonadales bacterium]
MQSKVFCRSHCRSRAHERISHQPLTQWQRDIDDLPQKGLGLQTRMVRNLALALRRFLARNYVFKWVAIRQSPKSSCLELAQAFPDCHTDGQRFPKETPRFKAAAWHRANIGIFFFRVLGPVPTSKSSHETNNFSPKLKIPIDQRAINKLGHKGIRCDEQVASWSQRSHRKLGPLSEEFHDALALLLVKRSEARQWRPLVSVERWRNAPNASSPRFPFLKLVRIVFLHAVWWICYDCVKETFRNAF